MEEKDQPAGHAAEAEGATLSSEQVEDSLAVTTPAVVATPVESAGAEPSANGLAEEAATAGRKPRAPRKRPPRKKKETPEVELTPEPLGVSDLEPAGGALSAEELPEGSQRPAALEGDELITPPLSALETEQAEPDAVEAVPQEEPAPAPARTGRLPEEILLELAEREVAELGEPVPLHRREPRPKRAASAPPAPAEAKSSQRVGGEDIVVPEATEETAPAPFLDFTPDLGRSPVRQRESALPPITTEILAEVRGVSPEEVERQQAALAEARALEGVPPAAQPMRTSPQRPQPSRPEPQPPALLPAPSDPLLVVVPEALLEAVPEDWLEEEAPVETVPAEARGRRRRKRGRERDRRPQEEAVSAPPEEAAAVAPARPTVQKLARQEEEAAEKREARAEREYKEILINVDDRETRIAVLEHGRLVELHVEREERVVGSVYKGRVCNVLPGMDAAFVDIGLERNAFLYVGDILFEDTRSRNDGGDSPSRRTSRDVRIADIAKPGQEMLVQVVKGPRGTKGARVSTKMSIPGRYLVLMPEGDHLGVSRKVEDPKERERLRRIGEQMQPKGFGLIIRTEAEGRTEQELRADLDYLVRSWQNITEKNKKTHAPAIIHKDLGPILKTIRDLFGQDVDRLVIDSREEYEKVSETLQELAPDLVDRVFLYDESQPLFTRYNVEDEIDRLLRRKVWLRNGAYLLLDTTEALTTIDVNTGKFVGTSSLAETILKTNLDAVEEIARQLRLRDIGGMIVLDFIDMASSRDRQLVMRALENAFKKDRTRIKIAHISPLGLVEMTRKRTSEAVTDVMSQVCPYCQGRGRVWSPETLAISIERQIRQLCASTDVDAILVNAHPEVAAWLVGPEGESVEQMERMLRRPIYIRARHDYHVEKYEILPGDMMEMEREMMPFHGGQVVDCQITKIELITPPRSAGWTNGFFVDVANGARHQGQTIRVRLTDVRRSFALGEPVAPSTAVDRSEPI